MRVAAFPAKRAARAASGAPLAPNKCRWARLWTCMFTKCEANVHWLQTCSHACCLFVFQIRSCLSSIRPCRTVAMFVGYSTAQGCCQHRCETGTLTLSGPPRRAMPQSLRQPRLRLLQMLSMRCLPPARLGSILSMLGCL